MKKDKKVLKSVSLITGAALTGSLSAFAAGEMNSRAMEYSSMGSGAEVRSEIMNMNAPDILNTESTYKFGELKCGEGEGEKEKKKADVKSKEAKKAESKTSEAKCGEGKCGEGEKKAEGEKKSEKSEKKTAEGKTAEGKTSEAKCGEGKCG